MKDFFSGLFSTCLGALLAIGVLIFTPQISDRFAYLNPTCDNPEGLSSLNLKQMYEGKQLSIKVTSVAKPPPGNSPNLWQPGNVIDGNAGSPWVPAETDPDRRLTFTFNDGKRDVQLICIVNGQASNTKEFTSSLTM